MEKSTTLYVGKQYQGVVIEPAPFGVWVQIVGENEVALMHQSDYSGGKSPDVGQTLSIEIISIEDRPGRNGSMRRIGVKAV